MTASWPFAQVEEFDHDLPLPLVLTGWRDCAQSTPRKEVGRYAHGCGSRLWTWKLKSKRPPKSSQSLVQRDMSLYSTCDSNQQFPLEVRTRVVAGFREKFFVDFRADFGTIGPCPTDWTKAMARKAASRKELGAAGLLGIARRCFEGIADPVAGRGGAGLADCLMSGLAVYGLKYASLPEFDEAARGDDAVRGNLRRLYGVDRAPSDTRMRERLDEVDPRSLRSCYRRLFAALQRGKGLEGFACLDGHYLLSVDGTGHHSSKKVHCPNCCGKHHRDGTTTYYHMMPGAVLVHPDEREVFPLAPEPIAKTDGSRKNDCEAEARRSAAAKRLLADVRREHPHLKLVVVEDALASNGPHIELLGKLDMRYIPGAKPGDHAFLFEWVDNTPGTRTAEFEDGDGTRHWFRWLNGAPLNDANFDLEVNFPEYREISAQGRERRFPWVTDLPVGEDDLMELMRAGRARWRLAGRQGRERDIQHPEEPGLRLRTQLRPRRQAPVDGAGAPDDAGLPDRPDPAALLRGVPPRAGAGEAAQVPVGAGAGRVPAGGGAGLGDAVRARHEGRGGRRGGQRHVVAGPPRPTVAGGGFFRDDESRRTTSTGPRRRVAPAPPSAPTGSAAPGTPRDTRQQR